MELSPILHHMAVHMCQHFNLRFDFPPREWGNVSEAAKTFIRSCLRVNQSQRPSATEALKDPWFQISKAEAIPLSTTIGPRLQTFTGNMHRDHVRPV